MDTNPYDLLAKKLDALPNGFPQTKNGAEIRFLAKLFTPEEAALTASLQPELETIGVDFRSNGCKTRRSYEKI